VKICGKTGATMQRSRSFPFARWVALLLLVAASAGANPRAAITAQEPEPDTPEEEENQRVRKLEDVDNWLRKLIGRYHIDVLVMRLPAGASTGYSGMADCIGVGNGSGVQCLIAIDRVPHLFLFGRNPDDMKIHYMEVDEKGIGQAESGPLRGSAMQLRNKVPNTPAARPRWEYVKRFHISPDGEDIRFSIELEMDYEPMQLRTMHFRRVVELPPDRKR
jgi:hypothetical protein